MRRRESAEPQAPEESPVVAERPERPEPAASQAWLEPVAQLEGEEPAGPREQPAGPREEPAGSVMLGHRTAALTATQARTAETAV
jgi:hypothetical protein